MLSGLVIVSCSLFLCMLIGACGCILFCRQKLFSDCTSWMCYEILLLWRDSSRTTTDLISGKCVNTDIGIYVKKILHANLHQLKDWRVMFVLKQFVLLCFFSALMLLVGWQKWHLICNIPHSDNPGTISQVNPWDPAYTMVAMESMLIKQKSRVLGLLFDYRENTQCLIRWVSRRHWQRTCSRPTVYRHHRCKVKPLCSRSPLKMEKHQPVFLFQVNKYIN